MEESCQKDEDGNSLLETISNSIERKSFWALPPEEDAFSVLFEISLTNVDKPSMEASEAARWVALFAEYHDATSASSSRNYSEEERTSSNGNKGKATRMPSHWGILLTSAPFFLDKVRMFKKYLAKSTPHSDVSSISTTTHNERDSSSNQYNHQCGENKLWPL